MSAIISALDNYTPSQIGENGSVELAWSNGIRERIIQLSFQFQVFSSIPPHHLHKNLLSKAIT